VKISETPSVIKPIPNNYNPGIVVRKAPPTTYKTPNTETKAISQKVAFSYSIGKYSRPQSKKISFS
jgi:hypothetical protein